MRVAIDVAQTCVERAGCGWHADAVARSLASRLGPSNVELYHHFGDWINVSTEGGTHIKGVAAAFSGLSSEEARRLWHQIEAGHLPVPGNPDIVLSNSYMAPRIRSAKLVYTVHDLCFWTHPHFTSEQNRLLCQAQMLKALSRADAFVFVSEQSRSDFERLFPDWLRQSDKAWRVIRPASRSLPAGIPPSDARFENPEAAWLHVGSIEPRKGIDRLMEVYETYYSRSRAKRPLLLIGARGWRSESTHARLADASNRLSLHYEGHHATDSKLHDAYVRAFGLVCTSHYEGFGLPIVEAAAYGLPLVSSNVPSFEPFRRSSSFYERMSFDTAVDSMLELEESLPLYRELSAVTARIGRDRSYREVAEELLSFFVAVKNY